MTFLAWTAVAALIGFGCPYLAAREDIQRRKRARRTPPKPVAPAHPTNVHVVSRESS